MTRGEVLWADYGIPFGSEPGFRRPVVIIQNDSFNKSRLRTAIVVPLTTNLELAEMPGNVLITRKEAKLPKDSVAVIPQLGVIDKARLAEKITKLPPNLIKKIGESLLLVLDI
jgi:mRNA interferase MazF